MDNCFYMTICECIDNGDVWTDGIFQKFKLARKRVDDLKQIYEPENFSIYIISRPFGAIDWDIIDEKIDKDKFIDYNEL